MSVNYLGSVYPSRAVITTMKERRVGRIVFVSSQAGQLGLFGFTAYSSSKFAIRGLAEALQMEVKPYNVYVTVAYPPDTDTPGFAEENKTKPLETRLISETVSVCKPEQVAKQIVKDAIQGNFNSSIGSDGYMLSSLTCGMAPVTSITEGLQQSRFRTSLGKSEGLTAPGSNQLGQVVAPPVTQDAAPPSRGPHSTRPRPGAPECHHCSTLVFLNCRPTWHGNPQWLPSTTEVNSFRDVTWGNPLTFDSAHPLPFFPLFPRLCLCPSIPTLPFSDQLLQPTHQLQVSPYMLLFCRKLPRQ
ncbi:3-ketodihydrosphingosine reductase isoform X3 [Leopardus geoffroyi]|nr:3-ketodihydrosphingosine reductase isoform X3 [Leopardus geoffroyi]